MKRVLVTIVVAMAALVVTTSGAFADAGSLPFKSTGSGSAVSGGPAG